MRMERPHGSPYKSLQFHWNTKCHLVCLNCSIVSFRKVQKLNPHIPVPCLNLTHPWDGKTRSTEYIYKRHCRAGSANQTIRRLALRLIHLGGFSICNNRVFKFGLNDAKNSIPMDGSVNVIFMREPSVHLLATPFYVEGLAMVPMLGQLIVLTAGG